ncbi:MULTISPECIES: hypothetical protein [unclassified Streptomyces]|uniref:hypothetical protein n=1 Tax=unclassified Streptomyces TaxID=2593676 RepID=UPI0016514DA0|nr:MULTISPECIES: hypothetical protein [unclassified Streptomyces]
MQAMRRRDSGRLHRVGKLEAGAVLVDEVLNRLREPSGDAGGGAGDAGQAAFLLVDGDRLEVLEFRCVIGLADELQERRHGHLLVGKAATEDSADLCRQFLLAVLDRTREGVRAGRQGAGSGNITAASTRPSPTG